MKNKRRVLSTLLALTVLGTTFIMSSTEKLDETLERAEEISRKLFATKNSQEENENKELLEILGESKEETKKGYVYSHYLKGLDGAEDYILVQREGGGYVIFEKESMELIEYSDVTLSPYEDITKDNSYYGGPINYYKKEGNKIKNLHTGKEEKEEDAVKKAKQFKGNLKTNRNNRKNKKNRNIENSEEVQKDMNPGVTGAAPLGADDYTFHSRKYISNYQYFVDYKTHGANVDSTCASVAAQMLLSYNDWAVDGRIIPDNDELPSGEVFFDPERYKDENLDKPYSDYMRYTYCLDKGDSTDNCTDFYEKMKGYINPYAMSFDEDLMEKESDERNNGASIKDTHDGIKEYLSDYAASIQYDFAVVYWDDLANLLHDFCVEKLEEEVDNNRPAIGSIWVYDEIEDSVTGDPTGKYDKDGHQIIVYGYQTIEFDGQELFGFIANFGWKNRAASNVWFNSDWVKGYLSFSTEHSHTAYEEPYSSTNSHVWKCSLCHATYVKGEHTYNGTNAKALSNDDSKYYTHHLDICSCGYKDIDEHTPKGTPQRISLVDMDFYNQYDSTYHLQSCKDCSGEVLVRHDYYFSKYDPRPITSVDEDRQTKHWGKCDCGREEKIPHKFYSYEKEEGNVSYHKSHCECGFWKYEPHYFKLNRPYCHNCGYSIE